MSHTKVQAALYTLAHAQVQLEKAMKANVGKFIRFPLTKEVFGELINDAMPRFAVVSDFQIKAVVYQEGMLKYRAVAVNLRAPAGVGSIWIDPDQSTRFDFIPATRVRKGKIAMNDIGAKYVELLQTADTTIPTRALKKEIARAGGPVTSEPKPEPKAPAKPAKDKAEVAAKALARAKPADDRRRQKIDAKAAAKKPAKASTKKGAK
ncbi:hypothetical protein EVB87_015 [Rhizobium phage RHph_N28_1]|nr:hypothetical protein EVB87_015 [Rhizobium phage RHph_N28_1]QIG74043.1 hypothetical protein EVC07_015 [Rhizobium phage RHph_N42]QXV73702.1 hypothetical protein [Rhizobium phage RHph_N46]